MKTFKSWLQEKVNDNTNIGDLARDSISDGGFPDSYKRDVYERYLLKMEADQVVIQALHAAWNTYISEFEDSRIDTNITTITVSKDTQKNVEKFMEEYRITSFSSAVEFLVEVGLIE